MLTFYCIGAQKSGTSWLHLQLMNHPDIKIPMEKELHFWDRDYDHGIDYYKSLFSPEPTIQGDMTPAYAILPPDKIKECYRHFPDLRLIFIVREPIARAWSSAMMYLQWASISPPEVSDQFFLDFCRAKNTVARGMYKACRDNWLMHYDPKQLLILHFDDIAQAPNAFLERCFRHLGVRASSMPAANLLKRKVNESPHAPIPPRVLAALQDIYKTSWDEFQPFVERV